MIDINDVIKEVCKRTGYDETIVAPICKHVFQYTVDTMKSDEDTKDLLFNQLFKFKLKRRFAENKTKEYTTK